nr:MAG TPA: hypothetical protein [Caudoviricetes sp.]
MNVFGISAIIERHPERRCRTGATVQRRCACAQGLV